MAKALAKASHKKNAKKSGGGPTVNKKILNKTVAPAAVGYDFQSYYKEERFKKDHNGVLKDAIRIRGCDYLMAVKVPSAPVVEAPGVVYNEVYISPAEFIGTKMELMSRAYEKFLFEQLDFKYLPAVGSDTPGQLVIAHDRDVMDDTPSPDENGVREFLAMEDMKAGNVWNPHTARCPLRSKEDGFFCNPTVGGDDRLAYQGQTYVACVAPSGKAAGSTLGILLVEYVLCFFIPQIQNALNNNNFSQGDAAPDLPLVGVSVVDGTYDVLRWLSESPLLNGIQAYLPKLQADGTWAITLPEGLFDWMFAYYNGSGDTSVGGTASTSAMMNATLEPLEPQAAPAPQVQVESTLAVTQANPAASTFTTKPVVYRAYLNIPRGGARLRQRTQFTGGTGTIQIINPDITATLTRLGGVVQSLLNLFPAPTPDQVKRLGITSRVTWQTMQDRPRMPVKSPEGGRKCLPQIESKAVAIKFEPSDLGLAACVFCKDPAPDHFGRTCPEKICVICGKKGPMHNASECPENPKNLPRLQGPHSGCGSSC